jgi:hypothetical protein
MVWLVIWVVFMLFWAGSGGYATYRSKEPYLPSYGISTLVPWVCVLIPGLILFGAITIPAGIWH